MKAAFPSRADWRLAAVTLGLGAAAGGLGCDAETLRLGTLSDPTTDGADAPTDDGTPSDDDATDGGGGGSEGSCEAPIPAHHFDFAGSGTAVVDLRGGPAATIVGGAVLDGSGQLVLDGVDDYVELAARPWQGSKLSIALWMEYRGVAAYQRLFDFGAQQGNAPSEDTIGTSYLALTPRTGYFPTGLAVLMTAAGSSQEVAAVTDVELTAEPSFVVVALDDQFLEVYHDGELATRVPHSVDPATLLVDNSWLGRSQYSQDPYAEVAYLDLRVYEATLSECQVHGLFAAGAP